MTTRRSTSILSTLATLVVLLVEPARAASIEVDAHLSSNLVGVGQLTVLTIEARIEGSSGLELDPSFGVDNLEIVSGPAQSQQVSFVNGRISRSQSLRWTLRPLAAGTARVRDLRLAVNQEVFELPEQVLEVSQEPVASPDAHGRPRSADPLAELLDPFRDPFQRRRQPPQAEAKLFLRAEASPRSPVVGQQVLYSLILFTQADIGAVNPDDLPDFEGLWVLDIEQPQRPKSVMTEVQGERYGRVVLLQKALFPLRPGPLTISPVAARLIARIPETSWMGTIGSVNKEYSLTSNAVSLDVQPLRDPPPGFRGAVGRLAIESTLEPRSVEVDQAATLTVSLSGHGHVQGLPAPALPELPGVRLFPPEQTSTEEVVGTTVQGRKTWSWVLVPERPGVWEVPPFTYDFFDPRSASFETATSQPKVLMAKGAARERPSLDAGSDAISPLAAREKTPSETKGGPGRLSPRAYATAGALVAVVLLSLLLSRSVGGRLLARHRPGRRLRQQLRAAAEVGQPSRVAQLVETAWREYLAERWHIAPSTGAGEWAQLLTERGVSAAGADDARRLAEDLHYLRYAPELAAHRSLRQQIVELSLRLLKTLR